LYAKLKPKEIEEAKKYRLKPAKLPKNREIRMCKCGNTGYLFGEGGGTIRHLNASPIGIHHVDGRAVEFTYSKHLFRENKKEKKTKFSMSNETNNADNELRNMVRELFEAKTKAEQANVKVEQLEKRLWQKIK
jgi:hypothetical protein